MKHDNSSDKMQMSSKGVTIIIACRNKEVCIKPLFELLQAQINPSIDEIVFVDDGSIDNTEELVNFWIKDNAIKIIYHYQKNQGMHGAHNTAYKLIDTELNVCIDSDDFMPDDAIEKILCNWLKIKDKKEFAGLVGLDATKKGEIIGTKIPKNITQTTMYDMYYKHGVIGDKKYLKMII